MLPVTVMPKCTEDIVVKKETKVRNKKMSEKSKKELRNIICELCGCAMEGGYSKASKEPVIKKVDVIIKYVEERSPELSSERKYEMARRKCIDDIVFG